MLSEYESERQSCDESQHSKEQATNEAAPYDAATGGRVKDNSATRWRNFVAVGEKRLPHTCFCETNPPFCDDFFDATATTHGICNGNIRKYSVGSFWKTNPLLGGLRHVFTTIRPAF